MSGTCLCPDSSITNFEKPEDGIDYCYTIIAKRVTLSSLSHVSAAK